MHLDSILRIEICTECNWHMRLKVKNSTLSILRIASDLNHYYIRAMIISHSQCLRFIHARQPFTSIASNFNPYYIRAIIVSHSQCPRFQWWMIKGTKGGLGPPKYFEKYLF